MNISEPKYSKLNRSKIFKRAHYLVRQGDCINLSQALKKCYKEHRDYNEKIKAEFNYECTKVSDMYNVEQDINKSMIRDYINGSKILN